MLVNDQLNQLYIEMELESLSTKLTLEEGITSSSSSGDEHVGHMSKVIRQIFVLTFSNLYLCFSLKRKGDPSAP